MLKIDLTELSQSIAANSWVKAQEIAAAGAVELQKVSTNKAQALIAGSKSEQYHTEIHCKAGQLIKMRCDCLAFEFQKSCKHGFALAIFASGDTSVISPEIMKKAEAKRLRKQKRQSREEAEQTLLADFLKTQSRERLESALLELVSSDKILKKSWLLKAELSAQASDPKVLKKQITRALPLKYLFQYRQVAQYFDSAYDQINELLAAAESLTPEARFDIIMAVYKRLAKVFVRVDDSGGFRFELIAMLDQQLEQSFNALAWTHTKKSLWLKKYTSPPFDVFAEVTKFQCYSEFI